MMDVLYVGGGFVTKALGVLDGYGRRARDLHRLKDFDEHWQDADRRERLLGYLRQVERDRSLMGASAHLLAVARRE